MDYPGKVISKNAVVPSQTSASGVWTLDDAAAAVESNTWPVAGVPNPISRSLRFNSADSAYLNRTPATAGNRRTWTWSGWVKRGTLGTTQTLFSAGSADLSRSILFFEVSTNTLNFVNTVSPNYFGTVTTAVFRDPSAWYHIVFSIDTTQATTANRVRIYVNNVEQTATSAYSSGYIAQNTDTFVNFTNGHAIGSNPPYSVGTYFSGYLTEINFIDGQALTPSDFGMTDPQTGAWIPKKYNGTYGTNGFYLNFSDNASTAALGTDYSGNNNTWTTNNFSVTAGAGNDSMTDVPTPWFAYNTTGDVGGVVRGNYATLNPIEAPSASVISNGNLQVVLAASPPSQTSSTIGVTSGKWYSEFTFSATASGNAVAVGVGPADTYQPNIFNVGVSYFAFDGTKYISGANTSYGATWTTGDIIGIALDVDGGTVTFYKNNTSQGAITLPASASGWKFVTQNGGGSSTKTMIANFGQRPFAYTPPAGFLSLCTTNLPTPTILDGGEYFNTVLYTGNGSTQSITGVGFQPDWVWCKSRSGALNHALFDAVRGADLWLGSNVTNAEINGSGTFLTAFNSDGFSVGSGAVVNTNAATYVAWNWKANGAGSTNTAGTITSTVSVNTTSGFSIVTFTAPTSGTCTVGHGLGAAPEFFFIKSRANAFGWTVYHKSIGADKYLVLNSTAAQATDTNTWNNTAPTSSVFTLGVNFQNTSTWVAYCFAAIPGYSAFGSYTGNGSADGPFIYTGFRPRYYILKNITNAQSWSVQDTARSPYNVGSAVLLPNSSSAELTGTDFIDILSNGFKIRHTGAGGNNNNNGDTYIYAAFAENPFKYSNAR